MLPVAIEKLKGVGAKTADRLAKLGIGDVGALLEFYPRAYEDWSKCHTVSGAPVGEPCCIKARICTPVNEYRVRQGMTLYKFTATDLTAAALHVTLFNNKYLAEKLVCGEEYLFFGKATGNMFGKEMASPQIEPATCSRIRPIYRMTQGLNSKYIEKIMADAVSRFACEIKETLPAPLLGQYGLCSRRRAIEQIHFPSSDGEIQQARKRLIFEELLTLQLGMYILRGRNRERTGVRLTRDYTGTFIASLPYTLTNAQQKAIKTALRDMARPVPMNRLLQGDVGSGKTAVASALLYNTAKNGFQSAMMAPTELLARQHYETLTAMLQNTGISVELLTGSLKQSQKREICSRLKTGETDIVIGTHALIQQTVEFASLGLVITDEQHRFGVRQRSELSKKGKNPHIFVMSATPIPRTLALIVYGDLDISVLDEMPEGRQKTETYAVTQDKHNRALMYVKKHLDNGLQGYVVCPMIDESELPVASAAEYYEKLKNGVFKGYTVGLLHSKMKPSDKEKVMSDFAAGNIRLLVSTTVIEVGVDIPNAAIMVIENAERFGLSQLHQLRGRIGRGADKATCILIFDAQTKEAKKRIGILCKTTDGFKIADYDLKLRGPGDFFGNRQHGLPQLKIADLSGNMDILRESGAAAGQITADDPRLAKPEHLLLKRQVAALFSAMN